MIDDEFPPDASLDDEPRALFALPGLDPHSGGFAVDVTFLLLGGASTIAVTLLASALARARSGERVEVVGAEPASETKPNPLGAAASVSEQSRKPGDVD
jgi:hypothetical protein